MGRRARELAVSCRESGWVEPGMGLQPRLGHYLGPNSMLSIGLLAVFFSAYFWVQVVIPSQLKGRL